MKKHSTDSVFLRAAGAAAMQCFSHFRQTHLQSGLTANKAAIKSASYESVYAEDLSVADRHLVFNVHLGSNLPEGAKFSFTAPANIKDVKSLAAKANGRTVPVTMRQRGGRTEILAEVGAQNQNKDLKLELAFNTPSMVLSRGDKHAFLADFLVSDAPIERMEAKVRLPGKWKFGRSLPVSGTTNGGLKIKAANLRPCEHQLMCFSAVRKGM